MTQKQDLVRRVSVGKPRNQIFQIIGSGGVVRSPSAGSAPVFMIKNNAPFFRRSPFYGPFSHFQPQKYHTLLL